MQQQFPLPVVVKYLFLDHLAIADFILICDPEARPALSTFIAEPKEDWLANCRVL